MLDTRVHVLAVGCPREALSEVRAPDRFDVVDGGAVFPAACSEESYPVAEAEVCDDVSWRWLAVLERDPLGCFVDVSLGLVVERQVVPPVGVSSAVGKCVVDRVCVVRLR